MVDWELARRVASGALILKPAPATYRSSNLQGQFDELTARAEVLVSEATGLHSAHGAARAKVTDRAAWATANVRSLQRLVGPALDNFQTARIAKVSAPALAMGRAVSGTQLGLMLAYMATRVLGQYDLLINDEKARGPRPGVLRGPECGRHRRALLVRAGEFRPLVGPARG